MGSCVVLQERRSGDTAVNVYTVIPRWLSIATYTDRASGMQYASYGRTRQSAVASLGLFLDNEPEIIG